MPGAPNPTTKCFCFQEVQERGRDPAGIEQQFLTHVKPMHDQFVEPSRRHADAIYSGEGALETQIRDLLIHLEIAR